MSSATVTLPGIILADGQLRIDQPVQLSPGPVQVCIQSVFSPLTIDSLEAVMERIWASQRSRGHSPRGRAEVDAGIRALRDEAGEELEAVEKLCQASELGRAGAGD